VSASMVSRQLNVLLRLIELAPDPRREAVPEEIEERLRWVRHPAAGRYWDLAAASPKTTRTTREILEEQYERTP
jgi:hypothetical protein